MKRSAERGNRHLTAISAVAVLAGVFISESATPARAYDLTFHQTSSSVPGLSVSASIDVDGGPLPTLDNSVPGPYDFGPLVGFDITIPAIMAHHTLADFTDEADPAFLYPQWSISPAEIQFTDAFATNHFEIDFGSFGAPSVPGTISFVTDDMNLEPCVMSGVCYVAGDFIAEGFSIPEPWSANVFGIALLSLGASILSRRRLWD